METTRILTVAKIVGTVLLEKSLGNQIWIGIAKNGNKILYKEGKG